MSCQGIFNDTNLAQFASTVGDSWTALARRFGLECICNNPSSCLKKWRDTFSKQLTVEKVTWALTKIGMSLGRKLTESLDEEKLDDWLETFALFVEEYWQPLAKKLDFSDDEIQAIVVVFDGHLERQTFHMLMYWKERYIYRNIMGELKLAVWEMRRHDLLKALGKDVLDDDMIAIAAPRIGSLWPVVAIYLGFDEDNIQEIANTSSDDKMRATTVLAEWREHPAGEKQQRDTARVLSIGQGHVAKEDPSSGPSLSTESSSHPSLVGKPVQVPETDTETHESDGFNHIARLIRKVLKSVSKKLGCLFETLHIDDGTLESICEIVPFLADGILLFQQGRACFYKLKKAREEWGNGTLLKVEALQCAVESITETIVKGSLTIGRVALGVLGCFADTLIPVSGTFVGIAVRAVLGAISGGKLSSWIGRKVGRIVPFFVSRDEQKVLCIKDLKTGDHVITENAKGIHAIISRLDILRKRITLVHTSTKSGVVTEETVDFSPPWRKVINREADTRLQYLVIEKARNMIGCRLQVGQGSEDFARWCKLKPK